MKPVNGLADKFHRESEEGVEAVFGRMFRVAGNHIGMSYAEVFDVSENTIKTWRRRGAVSVKFLQGFAQQYGVSLDYLMHGEEHGKADRLDISDEEKFLVLKYRAASHDLRRAALRVLLGAGEDPTPPSKKTKARDVTVHGLHGQLAMGKIVNKQRK